MNELFHVALNHRQDVREGNRDQEVCETRPIRHFAFFKVIATGFDIPVQGFDEHAFVIALGHRLCLVQVGDERERFLTIVAPEDHQVATELMFCGEEHVGEKIVCASLTMRQKRRDWRGRDIWARDAVILLHPETKADVEAFQPVGQFGGTEFAVGHDRGREVSQEGMIGQSRHDRG